MNFNFYMPVKIISGKSCVTKNKESFRMGKKCMIVTGKNSARLSGALQDVIDILKDLKIEYCIYDKINENPLVSVCEEGGKTSFDFSAEFIIGIGGGSAIDAAKAIAAFSADNKIKGESLFDNAIEGIPIIAIPTTAGTGSEVNNYSILSLDGQNKKRTFKSPNSYPKIAFLDASYTESMNDKYTLSTALDAFCHCIESYMSPKSTALSEMNAVFAANNIYNILKKGIEQITFEDREILLYSACAAGISIGETGTGFPHPMGYNLTMFYNVPHGFACAAFIGEFIKYSSMNLSGAEKINKFAYDSKLNLNEIISFIPSLAFSASEINIKLKDEEIYVFIEKVKTAANFKNNPYIINENEIKDIYKLLF